MEKDIIHKQRMAYIWLEPKLIDGFREFLETEFDKKYGEYGSSTYEDLFEQLDPIWTMYGGVRKGKDYEHINSGNFKAFIAHKLYGIASNEGNDSPKKGRDNITRFLAFLAVHRSDLEQAWFKTVLNHYRIHELKTEVKALFSLTEDSDNAVDDLPSIVSSDHDSDELDESENEEVTNSKSQEKRIVWVTEKLLKVLYDYWIAVTAVLLISFFARLNLASNKETTSSNKEALAETQTVIEAEIPLWDKISTKQWSTYTLPQFRPFLRKVDLEALTRAAEEENLNAMTLLGMAHHLSFFPKTDHGLELRKYTQPACDLGHARACALVAWHYRTGISYPKDQIKAYEYYEKSCDLGALTGCNYKAIRYRMGWGGVEKDSQYAAREFDRLCSADMAWACINIAEMWVTGELEEISKIKAQPYLDKACKLGYCQN